MIAVLSVMCASVAAGFSRTTMTPAAQASRAPMSADAVKARLLGNWMLVKYEVFGENGEARAGTYDMARVMWAGTEQVRYYGFSDDGTQLTLSLKSGERITQTLTWERVK